LHARGLEHAELKLAGARCRCSEQRGLPDPRLPAHYQCAAAVVNVVEEAVDLPQLGFAPDQLARRRDRPVHSAQIPDQGTIVARPPRRDRESRFSPGDFSQLTQATARVDTYGGEMHSPTRRVR
jgi:hypothetical protein